MPAGRYRSGSFSSRAQLQFKTVNVLANNYEASSGDGKAAYYESIKNKYRTIYSIFVQMEPGAVYKVEMPDKRFSSSRQPTLVSIHVTRV